MLERKISPLIEVVWEAAAALYIRQNNTPGVDRRFGIFAIAGRLLGLMPRQLFQVSKATIAATVFAVPTSVPPVAGGKSLFGFASDSSANIAVKISILQTAAVAGVFY